MAVITDLLSPVDISSLRAAIRLFSYFNMFYNNYYTIAVPLIKLLEKDCPRELERESSANFLGAERDNVAILELLDH